MKNNKYKFYKENKSDKTYWVFEENVGNCLFSFDRKRIYNLYTDYPHKLTPQERQIFDKENKEIADWVIDRYE